MDLILHAIYTIAAGSVVVHEERRVWAVLGDKMANPVGVVGFRPCRSRERDTQRALECWVRRMGVVPNGRIRVTTMAKG